MALTWGVAWVPLSLAFGLAYFQTWAIWDLHPNAINALIAEGFVAGVLNGAAFSIVLAAVERRRKLGELRPRRMAAYGALAGGTIAAMISCVANFVAPGAFPIQWFLLECALFAGLGAASAAGSLVVARRGLLSETPKRLLENAR